ncbi:MAG: site-specific DNA-methyltransferase, partial [Bacteroidetes bacterium 4572_77]
MSNDKNHTENPIENVQSHDWNKERLEQLKQLMPDLFTNEGKLNISELKKVVDPESVNETERYEFRWFGKSNAKREAFTPTDATLVYDDERSVNPSESENLIIEGENLAVLKLLSNSYREKVKCIYIDPPYNTGKDFVYSDSWKQDKAEYWEDAGITENGYKVDSNTETDGRFHSNWLNMMYSRLLIARQLLKEDGVIFISIDDNEVHHLRKLCDEVFGEENFLGEFIWKRRASSALSENNISNDHEYVISYQKSELVNFYGIEKDFKNYTNLDDDSRGPWVLGDLTVGMTASMRPNQAYDLIDPKTNITYPCNPNRVWAFIPESMKKMIDEGRVHFPDDPSKRPMQKRFQNELKSNFNPLSTLIFDKVGLNTEATKEMQNLMGGNYFDYTKPLSLVKLLSQQICIKDSD